MCNLKRFSWLACSQNISRKSRCSATLRMCVSVFECECVCKYHILNIPPIVDVTVAIQKLRQRVSPARCTPNKLQFDNAFKINLSTKSFLNLCLFVVCFCSLLCFFYCVDNINLIWARGDAGLAVSRLRVWLFLPCESNWPEKLQQFVRPISRGVSWKSTSWRFFVS